MKVESTTLQIGCTRSGLTQRIDRISRGKLPCSNQGYGHSYGFGSGCGNGYGGGSGEGFGIVGVTAGFGFCDEGQQQTAYEEVKVPKSARVLSRQSIVHNCAVIKPSGGRGYGFGNDEGWTGGGIGGSVLSTGGAFGWCGVDYEEEYAYTDVCTLPVEDQ